MATLLPINVLCPVIDASVMIALCAKESQRYVLAQAEMTRLAGLGGIFYAPNIIVGESLYALRRKLTEATLTEAEHRQAIQSLQLRMTVIQPPPSGEASLISQANQICDTYGASRSNDSLYIALADELSQIYTTRLLTFDQDMPKQATRNAPGLSVHLLQ